MPPTTPLRHVALLALGLAFAGLAQAQATITHDKALAGSITPGDTAGYPVTISQPGSYKLMSNLYVPAGSSGIVVKTAGVSLDLNGFTIQGPGSCTRNDSTKNISCAGTAGYGVQSDTAMSFMQLRNGTIQGFSVGVLLDGGRAEALTLRHNTQGLLNSQGSGAIVSGVIAQMNQAGLSTDYAQVQDSVLVGNGVGAACSSADNGAVLNSQVSLNKVGLANCSRSRIHFNSNVTDSIGGSSY